MRHPTILAALIATMISSTAPAADGVFKLKARSRRAAKTVAGNGFQSAIRDLKWQPSQTAVIVCDMWDLHHCLNHHY